MKKDRRDHLGGLFDWFCATAQPGGLTLMEQHLTH
jgi:hypothetical protein